MSSMRHRRHKQPSPSSQSSSQLSSPIPSQSEILWFNEINHTDAYRVGGKGANLGECTLANLNVPDGFCITGAAFDHHLATHNMHVETADPIAARSIILNEPLQNNLVKAIHDAYATLGNKCNSKNPLVAVRSSATAEDGASASFAGQMETLLGVSTASDVVAAVRHCWASVFAERVTAYRNFAGGTGSCCVVIQLLVEADAAGVMFTANPLSGALDEFVVTANWGIGESVVADLTTPDTFILNANNGEIISTTIGTKQKMVILVKDDDMSNKIENNSTTTANNANTATTTTAPRVATAEEVPVPMHQQNIPCITNQHLASLLLLGRQVLKHYNNIPQDIEWAIINDQVMLLQSRPITTLQQSEESSFSDGGNNSNGGNDSNNSNDSNDRSVGSIGKYLSEGAAREWSTVVDISIPPPSFKPVSLSSPCSPLSKTPKHVIF
jgi:phosphoenolpyruvate synthase/pyruvate phosphate dikinase